LVKIILADMAVTVAVESAVHLLLYKASSHNLKSCDLILFALFLHCFCDF